MDLPGSPPTPIGAPIEYARSILHVSDHLILRAMPAIHEINALREVL